MANRNRFRFGTVNHNGHKTAARNVKLTWVQCQGYRCLAFLDERGKWINFYTDKVLTDFVEALG